MRAIWQKIEQWLLKNAKPVLQSLAAGATEEELNQAEKTLGLRLPEDFALSYAIHNGQVLDPMFGSSPRFIYTDSLYPLSKALQCWNDLKDLPSALEGTGLIRTVGSVKPIWDSPLRVPIAGDDGTHYYFLDFDPATGGKIGQIIRSFHDHPVIEVISDSFQTWLSEFADQLEQGKYVFSDELGGLVTSD